MSKNMDETKSTLYDVVVSITKMLDLSKQLDSNSHDPAFQLQLVFDISMTFIRFLYERGQSQHYNALYGIHQLIHNSLPHAEFQITKIISTDAILTKQGQALLSGFIVIIQKIILEQISLDSEDWVKLLKTFPQLKNYTSSTEINGLDIER